MAASNKGGWKNPKAAEIGRKFGGRKIGSISEETKARLEFRRQYIQLIRDNAEAILQAQLDLALGIYEEKEDALTGKIKVYKRKPDAFTLAELSNQVMGRAPQKVEFEADVTVTRVLSQEERAIVAQGLRMALPASLYVPNEIKATEDVDAGAT